MTDQYWQQAETGAKEDSERMKEERLISRIKNCNRPFYYYSPLEKRVCCRIPTCKHWTCEHCNTVRATDERVRIDRALSEHGVVYVIYDLEDKQWPTLMKAFKSANITKDQYRRLPQDNRKLAVFFVGLRSTVRQLRASLKVSIKALYDISNISDEQWYELARKRQDKRASGNLGQAPDDQDGEGGELTSVRVISVRSNTIDGEIHAAAIEHANEVLGERNPHDKADIEDMIRIWAEAYESYLGQRGHKTYQLKCWQKMDLTAIQTNTETIAIKSLSDWFQQAYDGAKEEISRLGPNLAPGFAT